MFLDNHMNIILTLGICVTPKSCEKHLILSSIKHSATGGYCPRQETTDCTPQYNLCRGNQHSALHMCLLNMYPTEFHLTLYW
jgi:hypothetical protein